MKWKITFIIMYLLLIALYQEARLEHDHLWLEKHVWLELWATVTKWMGGQDHGQWWERKEQGKIPKPVMRISGRDVSKQGGLRSWERHRPRTGWLQEGLGAKKTL